MSTPTPEAVAAALALVDARFRITLDSDLIPYRVVTELRINKETTNEAAARILAAAYRELEKRFDVLALANKSLEANAVMNRHKADEQEVHANLAERELRNAKDFRDPARYVQ